jgi:ferric-dicitrate binding protein FerR (iron transport regulator)
MRAGNYRIDDFLLNESFQRFAVGSAPEDIEYWEGWANDHPEDVDTFNEAREIIRFILSRKIQPKHQAVSDEVFEKLQKQINSESYNNQNTRRKIHFRYWYAAASIVIIIGLTLLLKPGKQTNFSGLTGKYLEILVPKGQRSQVVLPDGTKVWLNSGTSFKYPVEFLKDKREVYIDGEAFFNVTHNKKLPFLVHMKENLSVKVYGTEFNVKCYSEEKIIETTLVNGNIKLIKEDDNNHILQEVNIKPNEKATYQKKNLQLVVTKLASVPKIEGKAKPKPEPQKVREVKPMDDIELITAWKDDALVFHNETFEEISIKMERWFGMKIAITDDDLKQERFTGKFVNKETIYQILDIFNRSEPIKYQIKNQKIIISRKKR